MNARFLLYLREYNHRVEGGSEHKVSKPILFRKEETMSGEEGRDDMGMNIHNADDEDLIDEFGQDPVRQARIERRNMDDKEFALDSQV